MTLIVTLQDGRRETIYVQEGVTDEAALEAFVRERHPFDAPWVKLASGEYVRHSFIVSIRSGHEGPIVSRAS